MVTVEYAFESEITASDRKLHANLATQQVIDYRAHEALAFKRLELAYKQYRTTHPETFDEFVALAQADLNAGAKYLSINAQTEELRKRGHRIPNNHRAFFARDLSRVQEFKGYYKNAEQRSKRMVPPRPHKSSTIPVVRRCARRFGYDVGTSFSSALRLHLMIVPRRKNLADVDVMVQAIASTVNGVLQTTKMQGIKRVYVILPKLVTNTFEEVYIELSVFGV
jgi:hypothetical protein